MDDVANKHLTKIAKSTLRMSDAGALVMGGQTKEEARSHLKKMGHSEKEIAKLEESATSKNLEHDEKWEKEQEATRKRVKDLNKDNIKGMMKHLDKEIRKEGTEDMKMSLDTIKRHQEELKNPNLDSAAREMREKQITMHKEKLKNVQDIIATKENAEIGVTESEYHHGVEVEKPFKATITHGMSGVKRQQVYMAKNKDEAMKKAQKQHAGTHHFVSSIDECADMTDEGKLLEGFVEVPNSIDEALKVGDDVSINAHTNKYHGKLGTISALNHAGNAHLVNIWHPTTGKRIASEHFPESSLVKESIDENLEARYSDEDRAAMAKHVMTMNKASQHLVGFEKANEHVHRNRYKKAKAAYDAIKNKYSMKEEQMPKNTLINDIKQKNENASPTIKNMLLAKVGQYVSNIKQSIAKESFLGETFWIKQSIADHSNQMQDKLAKVGYEGSEEHQDDLKFMGSLQKDLKNAKLKKNESLDKMDESFAWLTNDPEVANHLKKIDKEHDTARDKAKHLPFEQKVAAYKVAKENKIKGYEEARQMAKEKK